MRAKMIAVLREGLPSLVTFLVMPLLGWWLGGPAIGEPRSGELFPSFLAEPARAAFLGMVVLQVTATILLALRLPPMPKDVTARPVLLHWRSVMLETILVLGPFSDHRATIVFGASPWLRWIGVVLFGSGAGLSLWSNHLRSQAIVRLGQSPYEPVLLVDGPFRRLRYPSYLGLLALSFGATLLFRSWFSLGAFCLVLNLIVMRINEEDRLARAKFGIRWTAYSRHSWRLVPFIY